MRIVSGVFCGVMLLFMTVQYNDPDAMYWGLVYGVIAVWCGLVAFYPVLTANLWGRRLMAVTLALAAFGVVWYWPKTPGFWHQEVWWVTETAREGMGMMIAFIAMTVAWFAGRRRSSMA